MRLSKSNIKKSIICKGLEQYNIERSIKRTYTPKPGDLAIFKVLKVGKHPSIQGINGNNRYIFPGDYIMAAFGNRYATEQFEGYIPEEYQKEYHILGKGGAIGIIKSMHEKMEKLGPTTLRLIGYATDEAGTVINTKYLNDSPAVFNLVKERPYKVILSLGASMDSGKTTTAGFLCRGLRAAGKKVAYIKLTGTVFTKDRHFVRDCGANIVCDFSTLGFPSTYMCGLMELLDLYEGLLQKVEKIAPEYIVVEIADGLYQRETKMLLLNPSFMETVDSVIYSAPESLSAINGINILTNWGHKPIAISGLFTTSPLLIQEVRANTMVPVKTIEELSDPDVLDLLNVKSKKFILERA